MLGPIKKLLRRMSTTPQPASEDAPSTSTSHTTQVAPPPETETLPTGKCCDRPISTATAPAHPLDPLTTAEIQQVILITRREIGDTVDVEDGSTPTKKKFRYNTITLHEPTKSEFLEWQTSGGEVVPKRVAEVVAVDREGGVYDGLVELNGEGKVVEWERLSGVQPMLTMEDLVVTEEYVRKDERVIEQCGILGIPREDMGRIYCDREF